MNATVTFSLSPWLLFLILPVFVAILALVFARKKKEAISANLILSSIFQCVVASLFIFAIAGIQIEYDEKNFPSEAVVLVDTSYTAASQREEMDNFVHDVLRQSVGRCRVGVVLFGNGQDVALDMTKINSFEEAEEVYQKYIKVSSQTPDDNATDIASALRFIWSASGEKNFISDPARTRVVILSDGLETDGDSLSAMKELARGGIQLETSFYSDNYISDTSILGVTYPAKTIYAGEEFEVKVQIKSSYKGYATLKVADKDEEGKVKEKELSLELQSGSQEISFTHLFEKEGFHEFAFSLEALDDEKEQNNVFYSYFEAAGKNKILIFETFQSESGQLKSMLDEAEKNNIEIEIKNIKLSDEMTAKDLSQYCEVILYNTAASDMTQSFQVELQSYVQSGGGLFTVGGFEKDEQGNIKTTNKVSDPDEQVPVLHSYKDSDLKGSILADMLPVNVESYNPSVAVVFLFDVSTSMTGASGTSIETAAEDARYILDHVLTPRDYAAIVSLNDSYEERAPLTTVTKKEELKDIITNLEEFYLWTDRTYYAPAFEHCARILANAPTDVARKHIILFSDGGAGDSENYLKVMQEAYQTQGINLTVVTYYRSKKEVDGVTYYFNHAYDVVGWEINVGRMDQLAEIGHGHHLLLQRGNDYRTQHGVAPIFKMDLKLEDVCFDKFNPRKGEKSPILSGVTPLELSQLKLEGYFPSKAKIDKSVNVSLYANGAPLYAEWDYGSGKVGSILIDLEKKLSSDLLTSDAGKTLVKNMVSSLLMNASLPQEELSFEVIVTENNFNTSVKVFNTEEKEAKFVAIVQAPDLTTSKYDLGKVVHGSHFEFENPQVGMYNIYVMKVNSNYDFMGSNAISPTDIPQDMLIEMAVMHRAFSYSKEFDATADPYSSGKDLLASLSSRPVADGNIYSKFVYDAEEIFSSTGNIHFVKDLRFILLISAMVLYIMGITFRLFKLKKRNRKELK